MHNENQILFVVVLYKQKYESTNVYNSLLIRVPQYNVLVWDNSLDIKLNNHLNSWEGKYINSISNVGVSLPYNYACEYAFKCGYSWIMLLDQDTTFADNFMDELVYSLKKHPYIKLFFPMHCLSNGLFLSPVKLYMKFSRLSNEQISGVVDITKYAIINSGMLVNVEIFREAGGYNEKVFLDYSDFQFIDRLAKINSYGYCLNSICIQNFSNDCIEKKALLNRFSLFCQSLKGCEYGNIIKAIGYNLVVLKRCFSLVYRLKSFRPFSVYFNCYIK